MGAPKNQLEQSLVLLGLYLKSGKINEAERLLQRVKPKFIQAQAGSLWAFWHAQVLLAQGKPDVALKEVAEAEDPRIQRQIRTLALREISRRSGNWQPFCEHLEVCFRETQEGEFLLDLCQLKAHRQEWDYVADCTDSLIRFVGTADACRLAAVAAWNARRSEQCLQLLRENRHLFPGNVLPNDLRRMEALCQARLGFLSQAVADAEKLVQLEESAENLLALMELQLQKGDLKGLALTARRFALREDVQSADLLRVARVVLFEDAELAKEFWRRARTNSLADPTLLNQALALGFQLGLDAEMAPLIKRSHGLAVQGKGAQLIALRDILTMMRTRAEEVADINRKYSRGEIFIHGVAERLGVPLARVFHQLPEQNRRAGNPLLEPALFIRHGGRPLGVYLATSGQALHLHLDITAILLAADLDILDKVEKMFAPLRIAPSIPTALVQQQEMLIPHQPSRLTGYRRILRLLREGKLQPIKQEQNRTIAPSTLVGKMGERWMALLESAKTENAYMIDYLPLRSNDVDMEPVSLSEDDRGRVANCRALVERLRCDGYLSEAAYEDALRNLGGEGVAEIPPILPPAGAKIFLVANTASVLADANLLEVVCCYFQTVVDTILLEEARRSVEEEERHSELRTWLGQLIDRVRTGLDNGTYECVTLPDSLSLGESEKKEVTNLNFLTLETLFRYPPQEGDVLWVDDRWVNSYAQRDGVPIISITEVLRTLFDCGALKEDEYYDRLLKLRAANMRYVPLERGEIRYHLKQAQVVNGAVRETEELAILRRYAAACLLDNTHLQRAPLPDGVANPDGELAFVIGMVRAVSVAMAECWTDADDTDEIASARADWILKNLHTGWFGIRHLRPDPDHESQGLDLVGLEIGGLLSQGIALANSLRRDADESISQRRKYFQWIETSIIRQRFKADPQAAVAAGDTLKKLLADISGKEYGKEELDLAARLVLNKFFLDLPKSILDVLQLDPEVMARLGVKTFATITLDQLRFERAKFLAALGDAVNGQQVSLETLNSNDKLLLAAAADEGGQRSFTLRDQDGVVVQAFHDPIADLFLDDIAARRTLLQVNRSWFDCRTDEFVKAVEEIASTESAADRVEQIGSWRQSSAAVFYAALEQQLRETASLRREDLAPPSAKGLIRHYRLDRFVELEPEGEFGTAWQEAATTLVAEEGLEEALHRIGSVPVKLPESVLAVFDQLSSEEKEHLCRELAVRWTSPVGKLHLLDITLRYAHENPAVLEITRATLTELIDERENGPQFRLFAVLLNFVQAEFSCWAETETWPDAAKLAMVWTHATRLQNLFIGAHAIPDELAEYFETSASVVSREIFARNLSQWNDILHPRRLNRISFLVRGVASICAAHDPTLVERLGVKELLLSVGFQKHDETWIPHPELLRDPVLAGNLLGSFLGQDQAETLAPYLSAEVAPSIASSTLHEIVEISIQNLERDTYQRGDWANITWVVEGLSVYKDLAPRFRDLLKNIDYVALHNVNAELSGIVLHLMAMQVVQDTDDSLRLYGKTALLNIVRARTQEKNVTQRNESTLLLVDTALALSIRPRSIRETTEGFAQLLQEMLNISPSLARLFRPTLFKLIQELPVRQLYGLWPVLLLMRVYDERRSVSLKGAG